MDNGRTEGKHENHENTMLSPPIVCGGSTDSQGTEIVDTYIGLYSNVFRFPHVGRWVNVNLSVNRYLYSMKEKYLIGPDALFIYMYVMNTDEHHKSVCGLKRIFRPWCGHFIHLFNRHKSHRHHLL